MQVDNSQILKYVLAIGRQPRSSEALIIQPRHVNTATRRLTPIKKPLAQVDTKASGNREDLANVAQFKLKFDISIIIELTNHAYKVFKNPGSTPSKTI